MVKRYIFENYNGILRQYLKLRKRLDNRMKNGSFYRLAFEKRQMLLKRLEDLRKKLSVFNPSLKPIAAAGALFLALNSGAAFGQTYVAVTGTSNPLNGVTSGGYAIPTFVDLDNDGDKDVLVGNDAYYAGANFLYYKNIGTSGVPVFTLQTGTNSPFNAITATGYTAAAFADLDNDGDQDMIIGQDYSYGLGLRYFKNTGSASAPVFTEQTGTNNPMNSFTTLGDELIPYFVDIDNDGDKDLFVGEEDGTRVYYFKNTGLASSPVFTQQTGTNNPLSAAVTPTLVYRAEPTFADIDNDGDYDAVIGTGGGYYGTTKLVYFKNTGTVSAPVFTLQTGTNSPFTSLTFPSGYPAPAFVDINVDGDKDLFVGLLDGTIVYFKNNLVTGVRDMDISNEISLYPNPAADQVNVSLVNDIQGNCDIILKNSLGMTLNTDKVYKYGDLNYTLNTQDLTSGIYFIEIKNDNHVGVIKFVKK